MGPRVDATRTRIGEGMALPGSLAGKTAVVTGASQGIGEAVARRFADAGLAPRPLLEYTTSAIMP